MTGPESREGSDPDLDARFAEIISHYHDNDPPAVAPGAPSADPSPDPSTEPPSEPPSEPYAGAPLHGPAALPRPGATGPDPAGRPVEKSTDELGARRPGHTEDAGGTSSDDDARSHADEVAADDPARQRIVWTAEPALTWRAGDASLLDSDDDAHFVPPPPQPLPAGDLHFWAIVAGLVGGPLLLLYQMLFVRDPGSWWLLLSVAMTAAGFVLLVARLPARRDEDDEDNGARV